MTEPIDIRPHDLEIVRSILKAALPPDARVWVFGSRAKWTTKDSSDLDLAIDVGRALTLAELGALSDGFEESDLPFKVDVVDWAATSEAFRKIIERDRLRLPLPPDNTPLIQLARLLSGGTPSKSQPAYWTGSIPWLTPKDMGKWQGATAQTVSQTAIGNGTRLAPRDTIFIAVRGMSLHNEIRIIRSDNPLTFNQDIKAIVPNKGVDSRYLYYALVAKKVELLEAVEAAGHGTGVLPTDKLQSLRISNLPAPEQSTLAELFGALDDKIELNRRMNETLEAMAQAIFKDWFVDFGPTRAKMEGRARYLAPDIWTLFPDRLDDEGKPEGWAISTIGQEVSVSGGSTPSTKDLKFWDGDIAWATPKDLSSLSTPVLLKTERQITKAGLSQISSGLLPIGTVLLSSRAPIGYLAITQIPVAVNQGFIAMVCNKHLSKVFVWLWTKANMEAILQNANGSTFQEISKTNFRPLGVTVATSQVLVAFDEAVGSLFDRIVSNDLESQTLAQIRDLLLPKLMSGEIHLRDAEKIGEAA